MTNWKTSKMSLYRSASYQQVVIKNAGRDLSFNSRAWYAPQLSDNKLVRKKLPNLIQQNMGSETKKKRYNNKSKAM